MKRPLFGKGPLKNVVNVDFADLDGREHKAPNPLFQLTAALERHIAADEAWADLRLAASKFQKRPTPENHVAAHKARRRWEAAS